VPHPGIDELPLEVLQHLATFLPARDALALRLATWRRAGCALPAEAWAAFPDALELRLELDTGLADEAVVD
jgi:hypothetical protein